MRLNASGAGTAVRSHFKSMHFRLETARLSVRRQINSVAGATQMKP
jgi:hypothetical protein